MMIQTTKMFMLKADPMRRRPRQQSRSTGARFKITETTTFLLFALAMIVPTSAFTMMAEYKPPVKSSVSKLGSNRYSSSSSSSSSGGPHSMRRGNADKKRSTSHQQHAAASSSAMSHEYYYRDDDEISRSMTSGPASFQERMRSMLGATQQRRQQSLQEDSRTSSRTATTTTRRRNLPANVREVSTLQEFKALVVELRRGQQRQAIGDTTSSSSSSPILAVRFYAPWCKACQSVQPYFYRMATQFPSVTFVDIPVTNKNTNLHQGLGVTSLPFGHIYHSQLGLMEESRMTKQHIPVFARKLQSYVQNSCDLIAMGDPTNPWQEDDEGDNDDDDKTQGGL